MAIVGAIQNGLAREPTLWAKASRSRCSGPACDEAVQDPFADSSGVAT
jgi:hypothetical protein